MENDGFVHLSAGDLLRAEKASGSEQAELISKIIAEGKIVPTTITCGLIKKAMENHGWASCKFLIDGYPRNAENNDGWNEVVGDSVNLAGVLSFEADEETLIQRIMARSETSGRSDDNIDTLRRRLEQYRTEQLPIIEIYQAQGKVKTINGLQEIEAVYNDIKQALAGYV